MQVENILSFEAAILVFSEVLLSRMVVNVPSKHNALFSLEVNWSCDHVHGKEKKKHYLGYASK